jgi:hypothetical protein
MKAIVSQIGKAKTQHYRQSCKNQSEKHSPPGNLIGPKDNEDCGRRQDNEHIPIGSRVEAMFDVYKNVFPGSNNHPMI